MCVCARARAGTCTILLCVHVQVNEKETNFMHNVQEKPKQVPLLRYQENPYRSVFFTLGVLTDYWVIKSSSLGCHSNYLFPFHLFHLLQALQFSTACSIFWESSGSSMKDKRLLHVLLQAAEVLLLIAGQFLKPLSQEGNCPVCCRSTGLCLQWHWHPLYESKTDALSTLHVWICWLWHLREHRRGTGLAVHLICMLLSQHAFQTGRRSLKGSSHTQYSM